MATVTFTTAQANAAVRQVNAGVTKIQSLVTSATASTGDVYVLNNLKIPHGAIVTDINVKGSVVDGTYILEMGLSGSNGVLDVFGSKTLSATAVLGMTVITTGLPLTISVSDDAALRYNTFAIRVDGAATSGTTSVSLQFIVKYYCP